MDQELARTVIGLPVAAAWPKTFPFFARSRLRTTTVAALSAIYVLAPQLPSAKAILLLLLTATIACALWEQSDDDAGTGPSLPSPTFVSALLLAAVAAALSDFGESREALRNLIDNDQVAITAFGTIACVFIGGALVAWILAPFTTALKVQADPASEGDPRGSPELHSLANAGRYIGWLERIVLFGFVLTGLPQAAIIALAAKSFARFPTLQEHHEGFAEYFLIGSLSSIAVALGAAAATRAAIGHSLLG